MVESSIVVREPEATDGSRVYDLVAASPPLDQNSMYANLLQCSHFVGTSAVAESGSRLLGSLSAYLIPGRADTLFVWQVAVHEDARGMGMASRMIDHILSRELCSGVRFIETTITKDNNASRKLFASIARRRECEITETEFFTKERHFDGRHDSEFLFRIGPFA